MTCLTLKCCQSGTDKNCVHIYKKPLRKFPLGRSKRKRSIILKWLLDRGENGIGLWLCLVTRSDINSVEPLTLLPCSEKWRTQLGHNVISLDSDSFCKDRPPKFIRPDSYRVTDIGLFRSYSQNKLFCGCRISVGQFRFGSTGFDSAVCQLLLWARIFLEFWLWTCDQQMSAHIYYRSTDHMLNFAVFICI